MQVAKTKPRKTDSNPTIRRRKPTQKRARQLVDDVLEATAQVVGEVGYDSASTNKIARRAGFSPQTFYRWYGDKIAVFIAAYEAWEQQERCELETLVDSGSSASIMANAIVRQHRHFQGFRRSLRQPAGKQRY